MPLCAPTGSDTTSASNALGAGNVTLGQLDATWVDQSGGASSVTLRVLAGSGCSGDVCRTLRDLNLSATGASPLRLALADVALDANETLVVEVDLDCSATFGSCAGASEDVHVGGWLVRPAAAVTTS